MSLAVTHFAFGAAMTAILIEMLVPSLRYKRTAIVAGGLFALVPDLHYVTPVYHDAFFAFHESRIADIFWFHWTMDKRLEPGRGSQRVAGIALLFFLVTIVVTEWYEQSVREAPSTGDE